MRYYTLSKVENDEEKIARQNGMFLTIFSILAFVCLLCSSIIVYHVETIFGTGMTAVEMEKPGR